MARRGKRHAAHYFRRALNLRASTRVPGATAAFPLGSRLASPTVTMTPSQVRAELLGEHFELRRLIEQTRALLDGEHGEALHVCMERLGDALYRHSKHEEQAVRGILEPIRARTPKRYAVMDDAHIAEHARLVDVLRGLRSVEGAARRRGIAGVLDELEAHMTEEEQVLLAEDVPGEVR
jgi:hypothetical protein